MGRETISFLGGFFEKGNAWMYDDAKCSFMEDSEVDFNA